MRHRLLRLQILYLVVAIGFNLVSIARIVTGRTPFTSSNLHVGMALLAFFAAMVVVRERGFPRLASALIVPGTVLMASSVVRHLGTAMDPALARHYAGAWSLIAAAGINLFGAAVFTVGIVATFVRPQLWRRRA